MMEDKGSAQKRKQAVLSHIVSSFFASQQTKNRAKNYCFDTILKVRLHLKIP